MTEQQVFGALGIEDRIEAIGMEWADSEKTLPQTLGFLEPAFIRKASEKFLADKEITETLVEAAGRISKNPEALRLLWHQHYLVAQNYERHFYKCYRFPDLTALGQDAGAYYLLLALSGYWLHGDWHQKKGIPETCLTAAIEDFKASVQESGFAGHYSGWWQGLFNGKLYRLGRLTFLQENYKIAARVFEHRESGQITVLSDAGRVYNQSGLIALSETEKLWISEIIEDEIAVRGSPISPSGFARHETVSLPRSEWREIVSKGEPVIGVHISPGQPMAIERCIDSFQQALDFNAKYFPEIPFKAFVCDSWLLDPNLKQVQPETSNIIQFQKCFHLIPSEKDFEFVTIRTIFGAAALKNGIDSVPHTTSLQKRAAAFKKNGGKFRNGLGIKVPGSFSGSLRVKKIPYRTCFSPATVKIGPSTIEHL